MTEIIPVKKRIGDLKDYKIDTNNTIDIECFTLINGDMFTLNVPLKTTHLLGLCCFVPVGTFDRDTQFYTVESTPNPQRTWNKHCCHNLAISSCRRLDQAT